MYPQFEKTTGFKLQKIISLEEPILTFKTLLYIFALIKVSSWLGDKYIMLIVMNVFIFYAPINKKFPHFLFYTRMYIKQIIEGTICILICLLPECKKSADNTKEKIN